MVDVSVSDAPARKVRKSFVITVDVDESASFEDLVFVDPYQDKEALLDAIVNPKGTRPVLFQGQEDIGKQWMSMGGGALPFSLFARSDVSVSEAANSDLLEALNAIEVILSDGRRIDPKTRKALRSIEDLLIHAENAQYA